MDGDFIPDIVLQDNTNQRLPCVLVLDASTSMAGEAIDQLNIGLETLDQQLKNDDIACQRVQLAVITAGGLGEATLVVDWTDAIDFVPPKIVANGTTPLGTAVARALEKIEEQKENYKNHQVQYNRPWLFVITDGEPNDPDWRRCAESARSSEKSNKVSIFCIGTEGANFETLSEFSVRPPLKLNGLNFKELFVWLSRSASTTSRASSGEMAQLEPVSWGSVPT